MDKEFHNLALAIVEKAVEDWRYLCNGGEETGHCNFKELEQFFRKDCGTYLAGTDIDSDRIYLQLRLERSVAQKRGAKKAI